MKCCCACSARVGLVSLAFLLPVFCGNFASPLLADEAVTIVRVEEDWTLTLHEPEVNNNSPQITCAMSPVGNVDGAYMTFELNHQSQPEYATGGLHVHAWNGEYLFGSAHTQPTVALRTDHETVQWTQVMSLNNGLLTYEVTNGSSDTWGSFGTGELSVSVQSGLSDLSSYDFNASITGTGAGYGANRVASLKLKNVRYVTDAGDVTEVNVNQDVLGGSSE